MSHIKNYQLGQFYFSWPEDFHYQNSQNKIFASHLLYGGKSKSTVSLQSKKHVFIIMLKLCSFLNNFFSIIMQVSRSRRKINNQQHVFVQFFGSLQGPDQAGQVCNVINLVKEVIAVSLHISLNYKRICLRSIYPIQLKRSYQKSCGSVKSYTRLHLKQKNCWLGEKFTLFSPR